MRIGFLTPEFATEPYFAGGLAQYLGRLVPALAGRGHDVEVFVTSSAEEEFAHGGARIWRVPARRWLPVRVVNRLLPVVGCHKLVDTQLACSLARGLDNALRRRSAAHRFDIIQAASWMASGLFAVRNPVAPVVIRVSSYGPLLNAASGGRITVDRRAVWALELAAMRRAAAVYAPSRFLAQHIRAQAHLEVSVVRPPFYVDQADEDPTVARKLASFAPYLLFFGRISRLKGAGLLAEAIPPLLEEFSDLHLVVAGPEGGDPTAAQLLSLERSAPHRVHWAGILPPHVLRPVIRAARAVVLPSLADNLPNTCLEAMGLGQLVIGPDGASFDELITEGESGALFELGNVASLRHAISRVWQMPDEVRAGFGQRARARLDEVEPHRAAQDLEHFYEEAIAKSARTFPQPSRPVRLQRRQGCNAVPTGEARDESGTD
jgi:glycosyltransferase involved in cell wall biosynthesis